MHPIRFYELPYRGIDERVSRLPFLKHFPCIRRKILIPGYISLALLEFELVSKWKIISNMIPEFAPDNLGEEYWI